LVDLKYWKNKSPLVVARELSVAESTYHYWRNWIVRFVGYYMGLNDECPRSPYE
jgi:hypothetical protein